MNPNGYLLTSLSDDGETQIHEVRNLEPNGGIVRKIDRV